MRLLLVYGYEPSGHASAAAALEAEARAAGHEAIRLAISSHYHPILGQALAKVYLKIIQNTPGFWKYLYDNPNLIKLVRRVRQAYLVVGGARVRETLASLRPDLIVCVHAAPLGFIVDARAKGAFSAPIAGVLTDFGVHGYWLNPKADRYFVASEDAKTTVERHRVDARVVHATGIPIHPDFAQPVDRAERRRALGAAAGDRVVVMSGGSRGLGRMAESVRSTLERCRDVLLVVVCGSNLKLKAQLQEEFAGDRRLRVLGFQKPAQMRDLYAAADVVVGKAGGLTSAECLAMGAPLVIVDPIPGQEERNAIYLTRKGAALRAGRPQRLGGLLSALLGDKEKLAALRSAATALGRPAAARETIRLLVSGL